MIMLYDNAFNLIMLQYWSLNQITHGPCRKLLQRVCKEDFVLLFLFLSGWELLSLFSRFTHITKLCWNQYFVFGPGWSSQAEQPRGPGVCLVPGFPTTPFPKGRWVLPATFHGVTWMDPGSPATQLSVVTPSLGQKKSEQRGRTFS